MKTIAFILAFAIMTTSCGVDCIERKTGMPNASGSIKESKEKNFFQFQLFTPGNIISLDSGRVFKIKSAWVENKWSYECINNRAVIEKDSNLQIVIKAEFDYAAFDFFYWLMYKNTGAELRSGLNFSYAGEDTIKFTIAKEKLLSGNKLTISRLVFYKK